MTKWTPHYTGIETAEQELNVRVRLYRQRDRKTGKLRFIRLSSGRRMIGSHLGRTNYGSRLFSGGFELFTNSFSLMYGKRRPGGKESRFFARQTSGSQVEPYTATILAFGRIGIRFDTPEWLKRRYEKAAAARWADMIGDEA